MKFVAEHIVHNRCVVVVETDASDAPIHIGDSVVIDGDVDDGPRVVIGVEMPNPSLPDGTIGLIVRRPELPGLLRHLTGDLR